eukprot:TRINITY_DN13010_c0_g1_i1.p1 TRINITY_DN13010_c0_g1~~TRINITY_DN13010_c0_g1_i1.p1  ORF type:complete len:312 (-),score=28.40 TRINITY_DN13010_c0_g1_i1:163-1098(-)
MERKRRENHSRTKPLKRETKKKKKIKDQSNQLIEKYNNHPSKENEQQAKTKLSNCLEYSYNDIKSVMNYITSQGYVCLSAETDAERLCSILVKEGIASAIYSADTDTLVHGCPIQILKIVNNECQVTRLSNVLKILQLDLDQFVDFCILCGCDYNTNIPNIGPVKAYNFIREHYSIDNLKSEHIDVLRYVECRKIFKSLKFKVKIRATGTSSHQEEIQELYQYFKTKGEQKFRARIDVIPEPSNSNDEDAKKVVCTITKGKSDVEHHLGYVPKELTNYISTENISYIYISYAEKMKLFTVSLFINSLSCSE